MLSRQLQYQYPFYKLNGSTDADSVSDSVAMGTLTSTSSFFVCFNHLTVIFKSLKNPIHIHFFYNLNKCFTNFTPPKHFCCVVIFYFSTLIPSHPCYNFTSQYLNYTFYFVCLLFVVVPRASTFREKQRDIYIYIQFLCMYACIQIFMSLCSWFFGTHGDHHSSLAYVPFGNVAGDSFAQLWLSGLRCCLPPVPSSHSVTLQHK